MRAVDMVATRKACEALGVSDTDIQVLIRRQMEASKIAHRAQRHAYREAHETAEHRDARHARHTRQQHRERAQQARFDTWLCGSAAPMVASNWLDEM